MTRRRRRASERARIALSTVARSAEPVGPVRRAGVGDEAFKGRRRRRALTVTYRSRLDDRPCTHPAPSICARPQRSVPLKLAAAMDGWVDSISATDRRLRRIIASCLARPSVRPSVMPRTHLIYRCHVDRLRGRLLRRHNSFSTNTCNTRCRCDDRARVGRLRIDVQATHAPNESTVLTLYTGHSTASQPRVVSNQKSNIRPVHA